MKLFTLLTALIALAAWQLRAELADERQHNDRLRVLDAARRNGGL